ncbi:Uncharacterised protein [Mycobacterium tuberculosis]|nr:Uncharacterised protein [Mycobacterium tuberculosis]
MRKCSPSKLTGLPSTCTVASNWSMIPVTSKFAVPGEKI